MPQCYWLTSPFYALGKRSFHFGRYCFGGIFQQVCCSSKISRKVATGNFKVIVDAVVVAAAVVVDVVAADIVIVNAIVVLDVVAVVVVVVDVLIVVVVVISAAVAQAVIYVADVVVVSAFFSFNRLNVVDGDGTTSSFFSSSLVFFSSIQHLKNILQNSMRDSDYHSGVLMYCSVF